MKSRYDEKVMNENEWGECTRPTLVLCVQGYFKFTKLFTLLSLQLIYLNIQHTSASHSDHIQVVTINLLTDLHDLHDLLIYMSIDKRRVEEAFNESSMYL